MHYEFDWKEYVAFAQHLLDSAGSDEDAVRFRTCVSRAYYGAFCVCRQAGGLEEHRIEDSIHTFVIRYYLSSKDRSLKNVGRELGELKRHRLRADYDSRAIISKRVADTCLVLANRIIENFP